MLLLSTRSAFDNSVDFDGEDMNGEGVMQDTSFFKHFFKKRLEAEAVSRSTRSLIIH